MSHCADDISSHACKQPLKFFLLIKGRETTSNYPFSLQRSASLPNVFYFSMDEVATSTFIVASTLAETTQSGVQQPPVVWPAVVGPLSPFRHECCDESEPELELEVDATETRSSTPVTPLPRPVILAETVALPPHRQTQDW